MDKAPRVSSKRHKSPSNNNNFGLSKHISHKKLAEARSEREGNERIEALLTKLQKRQETIEELTTLFKENFTTSKSESKAATNSTRKRRSQKRPSDTTYLSETYNDHPEHGTIKRSIHRKLLTRLLEKEKKKHLEILLKKLQEEESTIGELTELFQEKFTTFRKEAKDAANNAELAALLRTANFSTNSKAAAANK